MSKNESSKSVWHDNWYLIVAVAVLLMGGIVAAFYTDDGEKTRGVVQQAGNTIDVVIVEKDPDDIETTGEYTGLDREGKLRKDIENYEKRIAEDPDAETVPGDMMAMANAFVKLQEWEAAATTLEDLLSSYPDHPITRSALFALGDAYEKMNDLPMARSTYRRMIEKFDPTSQEHRYAQEKLSGL